MFNVYFQPHGSRANRREMVDSQLKLEPQFFGTEEQWLTVGCNKNEEWTHRTVRFSLRIQLPAAIIFKGETLILPCFSLTSFSS